MIDSYKTKQILVVTIIVFRNFIRMNTWELYCIPILVCYYYYKKLLSSSLLIVYFQNKSISYKTKLNSHFLLTCKNENLFFIFLKLVTNQCKNIGSFGFFFQYEQNKIAKILILIFLQRSLSLFRGISL